MATKFQIGDVVSYALCNHPTYKVVATIEKPHVGENVTHSIVPEGFQYLIVQIPLVVGEVFPFIPVYEPAIDLI